MRDRSTTGEIDDSPSSWGNDGQDNGDTGESASSAGFTFADDFDDIETTGEEHLENYQHDAFRIMEHWRPEDFRVASERTRSLTYWGVAALVVLWLMPSGTTLAGYLSTAVFYTTLVVTISAWSVHSVIGGHDSVDEIRSGKDAALLGVAVMSFVFLAHKATQYSVARVVWRYIFNTASFTPDGGSVTGTGMGVESDPTSRKITTWGVRVIAGAAVIIIADAVWVIGTTIADWTGVDGDIGLDVGWGSGGGVDWSWFTTAGTGITTLELVLLYVLLFIIGIISVLWLSVHRG